MTAPGKANGSRKFAWENQGHQHLAAGTVIRRETSGETPLTSNRTPARPHSSAWGSRRVFLSLAAKNNNPRRGPEKKPACKGKSLQQSIIPREWSINQNIPQRPIHTLEARKASSAVAPLSRASSSLPCRASASFASRFVSTASSLLRSRSPAASAASFPRRCFWCARRIIQTR